MKILLTGGAGFIGSHLAERLLGRGETVVILDDFNSFYDPEIKIKNVQKIREKGEFILYREDLLNSKAIREIFDRHQPEAVIHLAAYAGVRPSLENPALYCEVNVTGTARLLEICKDHGVKHFIFGSSSSVYGVSSRLPFGEDDPVDQPISPYAATKRAGELLCSVYHQNYNLPVTCLRFFTVYGPRQRPEMAIHKFTRQIQRGQEIAVYHEGRSERDYTYVDDIMQGVLAALDRASGFKIFNLGNSRTVVLQELIGLIERALGKEAKIRLLPAQPGDVPVTFADISRAEEALGYSPVTSIEQGVPRFVDWYLKEMKEDN
ncbi:MAG: NAD-dependent epimerase/dehydratase family protein [Acidobacteriota bacterium]